MKISVGILKFLSRSVESIIRGSIAVGCLIFTCNANAGIVVSPSQKTIQATSGVQVSETLNFTGAGGYQPSFESGYTSSWGMSITPVNHDNNYADGLFFKFTPPSGFTGQKTVKINVRNKLNPSDPGATATYTVNVSAVPAPFAVSVANLTIQEREVIQLLT